MLNLRIAVLEDAASIARVHNRAWQTTYRGVMSDKLLDNLNDDDRARRWKALLAQPEQHTFVVEDEHNGIFGFTNCGPERRGDLGFAGELYAIYILEKYRGRGIGKLLFWQTAQALKDAGFDDMMIWVLESNPYRKFYEAMRGEHFQSDSVKIGGNEFAEYAYGWRDLATVGNA